MMGFIVISLSVLASPASQGAQKARDGQDAADKHDTRRAARRIVVVVSAKNAVDSLTAAELARIFLRKKTHWPSGDGITVYERPIKKKIRQEFSKKVLDKKPEALHEYWMNLKLTRGLKPPKVLRSAKLVRRYLARVKGGIGYLYEDEVDETVKVLEIVTKDRS